MRKALLTAAALLPMVTGASAAPMVFTSGEAFGLAVGGNTVSLEFDGRAANAPTITLIDATSNAVRQTVTSSASQVFDPMTANNVQGVYNGFVNPANPDAAQTITFRFSNLITGFSGTFGRGQGLLAFPDDANLFVTADFNGPVEPGGAQTFEILGNFPAEPGEPNSGFFGIAGPGVAIGELTFSTTSAIDLGANTRLGLAFSIDGFNFGPTDIPSNIDQSGGGVPNPDLAPGGGSVGAPVPVPAALPLMGLAMGLFAAFRRRTPN